MVLQGRAPCLGLGAAGSLLAWGGLGETPQCGSPREWQPLLGEAASADRGPGQDGAWPGRWSARMAREQAVVWVEGKRRFRQHLPSQVKCVCVEMAALLAAARESEVLHHGSLVHPVNSLLGNQGRDRWMEEVSGL